MSKKRFLAAVVAEAKRNQATPVWSRNAVKPASPYKRSAQVLRRKQA